MTRNWVITGLAVVVFALAVVPVLAWPRLPDDSSPEAGFGRDMSVHHAQAVEMAELLRQRTEDPNLRQLATDIVLTQQAQIGRISGWLDSWGLRQSGGRPSMAWMGMAGEPMPGMARRAEISALATLPLAQAEERFLRLMIRHHRGGIAMASMILDMTSRPEVVRLAESIVAGQISEIEAMQGMLEARGLEREPATEEPMMSPGASPVDR